jgi:uncharacterized membrane protein
MKHPLRLVEFDAHHRVAVALMVAALTFGISSRWLQLPVSLIASWDAFALCSLVLAWAGMIFTDARTRVREAQLQDSSRAAICGCVVFAAVAGLFGVMSAGACCPCDQWSRVCGSLRWSIRSDSSR